MKIFVPLGRVLFAAIFIVSGLISHLLNPQGMIAYATSMGVPMPRILVPLTGLIALAGGLSLLMGFKAKIGAWLIVFFLVPVTLTMHKFWGLSDPQMTLVQQAMFLKNLSMLGGALLIAHFGAGPFSVDEGI